MMLHNSSNPEDKPLPALSPPTTTNSLRVELGNGAAHRQALAAGRQRSLHCLGDITIEVLPDLACVGDGVQTRGHCGRGLHCCRCSGAILRGHKE